METIKIAWICLVFFECVFCQSVEVVSLESFYLGEEELHVSCIKIQGISQVNAIKISLNHSDIASLTYNRTTKEDQINILNATYKDRPGLVFNGSLNGKFFNMTIDRKHVYCNDSGSYKCTASGDTDGPIETSDEKIITGKKRATSVEMIQIQPDGDILDGEHIFDINTTVILIAEGGVGSDAFQHRWCVRTFNETEFQDVTTANSSTNTSLSYNNCTFLRKTILEYKVTERDVLTRLFCEVKATNTSKCGNIFLDNGVKIRIPNNEKDQNSQDGTTEQSSGNPNLVAIIGGIIGGVVVIFIATFVVFKVLKRKKALKYKAENKPDCNREMGPRNGVGMYATIGEVIGQKSAEINYAILDLPAPTMGHPKDRGIDNTVIYAEIKKVKHENKIVSVEKF